MIVSRQPKISDDFQLWFLANYQDGYQAKLALLSDSNHFLYVGTQLSKLAEISPILLPINNQEQLQVLIKEIEHLNLNGIFIEMHCDNTQQDVLNLLQQRLFVIFDGNRKGIFHFQNPHVISHFLRDSTQRETEQWLSMIQAISWFDNLPWGTQDWQTYINQSQSAINIDFDTIENGWILSASQTLALGKTIDDQILNAFFQRHSKIIHSPRIWNNGYTYINDAEQLNIRDLEDNVHFSLDKWLLLAFTYSQRYPYALSKIKNIKDDNLLNRFLIFKEEMQSDDYPISNELMNRGDNE